MSLVWELASPESQGTSTAKLDALRDVLGERCTRHEAIPELKHTTEAQNLPS